jgi:hypothetical protein
VVVKFLKNGQLKEISKWNTLPIIVQLMYRGSNKKPPVVTYASIGIF